MELKANDKKNLEINVGEDTYFRYAIKTHFIELKENYIDIIKVFEEYGEFGIENPSEPYEVCKEIEKKTKIPCMIVDANDLGQELLGYSPKMEEDLTEEEMLGIIKDNPAGQGRELTPIILIRKKIKECNI